MNATVICPVYNGENYIKGLHDSILKQKLQSDIKIDILYLLTESKDKSEQILKDINAKYIKIKKNEFSHSLTREKAALSVNTDIIVFISQDIKIERTDWLNNLIQPIILGECEASFSRQLTEDKSIEKYTRINNYPCESRIVSKDDIEELGLLTFFYSDASSAIKADLYKELNAYDNKKLIINEDMYLAEKIICSGHRIKYCADSVICHSHTFTLGQLFSRYFDTGVFFADNKQFSGYNANSSGFSMLFSVFSNSLKDKNIKVIIRIVPDFAARFLGSFLGKRYKSLPKNMVKRYSSAKNYWDEK